MADSTYLREIAIPASDLQDAPRHAALVRATHWIHTVSFFALTVSGIAILIAHPRLYWGETGSVGTAALIELPISFTFGETGWGRSLHFLAAWAAVLNGSLYVLSGVVDQHFRRHLLPSKADLAWGAIWRAVRTHARPSEPESRTYNTLQRLAYLAVVFVLFPLAVVTGLAMSPAITSVIPALVTVFGGHQSARTIHFFDASLLVLFLIVHITMVCRAGFVNRVGAMITSGRADWREPR